MSSNGSHPDIPLRDEDVADHLQRWLNQFKGLWVDAATRTTDAPGDPPNVSHAGAATEIRDLSELLSTRANAVGFDYRQYLTSDRNLAELAVIDTVPKDTDIRGESAVFDPDIIAEERSILEHLIPADEDRSVVDTVRDTMETFRLLQNPNSFDSGDPLGVLDYDPEAGSKPLQKQWGDIDGALDSIFADWPAGARFMRRARIRDLIFQNFNSNVTPADRPVKEDILPTVSDGIHDHITVLLTRDPSTIRKMEQRLPLDGSGGSATVSNQFKVDDYQKVGRGQESGEDAVYKMTTNPDGYPEEWVVWKNSKTFFQTSRPNSITSAELKHDQPDLFTENAALQNIGDRTYAVNSDSDSFTNFVPGHVQFINEWADRNHTYNHFEDELYVWDSDEVIDMAERKARYERLGLLHTFGQHPGYEKNPAVLGSVLHHLLRFGLIRARLSAEARSMLLETPTELGANQELSETLKRTLVDLDLPTESIASGAYETDPRVRQFLTSLRYLRRLDQDELDQLLRETVDLASHRLDAWWTSLATRRLADLRNGQGNWYVPTVDYDDWHGSEPYVPPGPTPPERSAENEGDSDAGGGITADSSTEQSRIETLLTHLNTIEAEYDGEDSLYSSSFFDAIEDALAAYDAFLRPDGTFSLLRSEELSYLGLPVLDDPDGAGKLTFFERATRYLDTLSEAAGTVEPVDIHEGQHTIRDELDTLERFITEGGDWSPFIETPFESMLTPPEGGTFHRDTLREEWAESIGTTIQPLIQTFTFAKEAAIKGAGSAQLDQPETTEDGETFHTPADAIDPGTELPSENASGIYVGAWGYVEDLEPDSSVGGLEIDQSEYIHAPSMEQATTAAILRGGHEAFEAQGDSRLSSIDLSPDRVRLARQLLDGVREGQSLGALLGYRFERALHEANGQAHIREFREAFPAFTGNLNGPNGAESAAKSDVVNGYQLYRAVTDTNVGLQPNDGYPDDLPEPVILSFDASDAQVRVTWALEQLFDAVDALEDVLAAESVHQFAQGNHTAATASLEAVAAGDALPDLDVIRTPRTETGLTHRLLVTFGDASASTPDEANTPNPWQYDSRIVHPEVPAVGADQHRQPAVESPVREDDENGFPLQTRPTVEPNLNSWIGDLLPEPTSVGCEASFEWAEDRSFASGSFSTPAGGGQVSVTDIGFEPDLILFTASPAIDGFESASRRSRSDGTGASSGESDVDVFGWTHGKYERTTEGSPVRNSLSLGYSGDASETVATADVGSALKVVVPESSGNGDSTAHLTGEVRETTADGFEFDVSDASADGTSVAVEYVAYKAGDSTMVEVGSFVTPESTGVHTEPLGLDADHISLTVTDLLNPSRLGGDGAVTQTATGPAGFSHGEAVGTGQEDQHAVSITQGPGASEPSTVSASQGNAIYLPSELVASVEQLDDALKLDCSTVSGPKLVTYVAVATEAGETPPRIGVVTEGENEVVSPGEEFQPACIEFMAVTGGPDGFSGGSGTSASASTAGWAHGVATTPGRERVIQQTTSVDAGAVGRAIQGSVVSFEAGDTAVTGSLESIDDRGFTMSFDGGGPDDGLVLYRAWPRVPTDRDHSVPASLTLDDLELSPLDVLFLSTDPAAETRSQLEARMAYYLHRNTDAAVEDTAKPHAEIPTDATISLRTRESDDTDLTVAEVLEVVRTLREMVTDGRAADADDFVPPAERAHSGYDRGTYEKLSQRTEPAHDALKDVEAQLENRLELLEPTPVGGSSTSGGTSSSDTQAPDPPNVCEQVDRIQERLDSFRAAVPLSGIDRAVDRIESATVGNQDILESELRTLADRLPAGASQRPPGSDEVTAQRLTGQTITGVADVSGSSSLSVRIRPATIADAFGSATQSLQFEKRTPVTSEADGAFEATFDFHDAPLGAQFDVVVLHAGSVVYSTSGRVVDPNGSIDIDPGQSATETVEAQTDLAPNTDVQVSVTSRVATANGLDTLDETVTTEVEADGRFRADVDVSDAVARTAIEIRAQTTGPQGREVYSVRGYVRDPTADEDIDAILDSMAVVPRLLWLGRYRERLNPVAPDSPASALQEALDGTNTDWVAIDDEVALISDWYDGQSGTMDTLVPRIDAADVSVLSALDTMRSTGLGALTGPLAAAVGPVARTVGPQIDVAGGHERYDGAAFWLAEPDRAGEARAAVLNLLRNPAGRDGFDQAHLQVSPAFAAFALDRTAGGSPFSPPLQGRILDHIQRLFDNGGWLVNEFSGQVSRPDQFLARFRKLIYRPEQFHADGEWSAFERDLQNVAARYRQVETDLPALRRAQQVVRDTVSTAPQGAQLPQALQEIESSMSTMHTHVTQARLTAEIESVENDIATLINAGGPNWLASDDLTTLEEAITALGDRIRSSEPLNPVDRLDIAVFDEFGSGPFHDMTGTTTGTATAATEFVYLLTALRSSLDQFEQSLAAGSGVFDAETARATFGDWWKGIATTDQDGLSLPAAVTEQLQPLLGVDRSARIDETFRRCVLETLRVPLLRASYFGIHASTPRVPVGGEATHEEALVAQAGGALERIDERLSAAESHGDEADRLASEAQDRATRGAGPAAVRSSYGAAAEAELARLKALFDDQFVVLPPLSLPNQPEVSETLSEAHTDELLSTAAPMETETWLQRTARVRDRPALFREALSYAEMVTGRLIRDDLRVGQLPLRDDDDWVGLEGIIPDPGQVSLVTLFASEASNRPIAPNPGTDAGQQGTQLAGLRIDEWRTSVPREAETTGVALNYDAPNTEPPQSILLAVLPDGETWSTETLLQMILETTDLAKIRGVDLQQLGKPAADSHPQRVPGHYLPALTFPLNTNDIPDSPSVDFTVDQQLAEALLYETADDANGGDDS